jgi:hypothetical protein
MGCSRRYAIVLNSKKKTKLHIHSKISRSGTKRRLCGYHLRNSYGSRVGIIDVRRLHITKIGWVFVQILIRLYAITARDARMDISLSDLIKFRKLEEEL